MKVRVYKSGLLSGLGHEHEISAPVAYGTVDTTSREVMLRIDSRSLRVVDPGISDMGREEIQSNMTCEKVQAAEHIPEIVFRGSAAVAVYCCLSFLVQTHPVTVIVR